MIDDEPVALSMGLAPMQRIPGKSALIASIVGDVMTIER
jgi:hypothetical protein